MVTYDCVTQKKSYFKHLLLHRVSIIFCIPLKTLFILSYWLIVNIELKTEKCDNNGDNKAEKCIMLWLNVK